MQYSNNVLFIICAVAFGSFFYSCQKEASNSDNQDAQTTDQATFEEIKSAIMDLGIRNDAGNAAQLSDEHDGLDDGSIQERMSCQENIVNGSTTITDPSQEATFDFDWNYQFTCADNIPIALSYNRNASGTIGNAAFTWTGSAAGVWNIDMTQADYILSGTYNRSGVSQSHRGQQNQFDTNLSINLVDVQIDKSSPYQILAGTGSALYQIDGTNGFSLTVPATIVFNGSKMATVTINDQDYLIDWN